MAIDLGSGNTTRYHSVPDHADFSLPNSDWAWITLCYPQSSTDVKYIISTGAFQAANSINFICYNTASGDGFAVDVSGNSRGTLSPVTHDSWYWAYATRRSNALFVGQVPLSNPGGPVESTGTVISSAYDSSTGPNIGRRSDGTTSRYWKGRWGQIAFVSGASITSAQAVELARGSSLLSMSFAPSIKALWHGRNANGSTLIDLIGGHVAAKQGTSYGTNEEDIQTPYIWTPEYIRGAVASSGSTGTVAYTNANDTSSASGTTTVAGSSATTNSNDTSSASGTTTATGSSATTNASDTSSAAGTTTVTGTASTINDDDTASASGSVGSSISGSVDYANENDTASASGTTVVTGSASAANSSDTSAANGTTTVTGSSATTNADDTCSASGEVGASEITGTVDCTNADDTAGASGTTTIVGSVAAANVNDTLSASGEVNGGIVVESSLTTGIVATTSIKKPGVPLGTEPWLKTTLEIVLGRRGNRIDVPDRQALTFSATPTQAECEALYDYTNTVRDSIAQLLNRLDS